MKTSERPFSRSDVLILFDLLFKSLVLYHAVYSVACKINKAHGGVDARLSQGFKVLFSRAYRSGRNLSFALAVIEKRLVDTDAVAVILQYFQPADIVLVDALVACHWVLKNCLTLYENGGKGNAVCFQQVLVGYLRADRNKNSRVSAVRLDELSAR